MSSCFKFTQRCDTPHCCTKMIVVCVDPVSIQQQVIHDVVEYLREIGAVGTTTQPIMLTVLFYSESVPLRESSQGRCGDVMVRWFVFAPTGTAFEDYFFVHELVLL